MVKMMVSDNADCGAFMLFREMPRPKSHPYKPQTLHLRLYTKKNLEITMEVLNDRTPTMHPNMHAQSKYARAFSYEGYIPFFSKEVGSVLIQNPTHMGDSSALGDVTKAEEWSVEYILLPSLRGTWKERSGEVVGSRARMDFLRLPPSVMDRRLRSKRLRRRDCSLPVQQ
ncbi:hypothetical protein NEOLEDRAFT_317113 [Neolentinus lepideus HHB14362 ss-1]|uniref:Uncharacterized protein n=1 Tax=Neolentinus lepideus HHB14362 ss-1 TaxID=1314782 RepID=A0A165VU69_9AGAM|nr:hypothetical protein NEOLEDRAFT_317113 [Neolentinus lepideus HHB14362 ss-1]